jgi:3-hydroxyisobutyrate dehydrogenase-like beta-hydroxyacid dehydrogenase
MKVAFLGLGKMGVPIVRQLLQAGHSVAVWNRTPRSTETLGIPAAQFEASIAAAVAGCAVAFTMLADDEATETVAFGADGMVAALPRRAIHVALGTLSVALSKRLQEAHEKAGQRYVAAPVFGRPNVAAQGKLWITAAGEASTLEDLRPLLLSMGRGLTVVGHEPWQAHAFKLSGNMLITAMVQSLSEAFVFATANGLDPELFLNTINEALFQSPMYANYGRIMLHPPEHPGATVALGAKDTRLLREAAKAADIRLGLAEYLQEQLNAAIAGDLGNVDWAVGQYRMAQRQAKSFDGGK